MAEIDHDYIDELEKVFVCKRWWNKYGTGGIKVHHAIIVTTERYDDVEPFNDSDRECPRCAEFREAKFKHTKLPDTPKAYMLQGILVEYDWARGWPEPAQEIFGLDYKPDIYKDPLDQSSGSDETA
ncbi:hypothetical protein MMC10_006051 [Thelotrema lepadinum]|nr:hypothetical protein [Thelotrema lepadinum]